MKHASSTQFCHAIMLLYNLSWVPLNVFYFVGKSNGKGYYIYVKGSKPKPDPSVLPITEESKRIANIIPDEEKVSHTYLVFTIISIFSNIYDYISICYLLAYRLQIN